MIKTPAFFIDMQICTGCKTCMVACKDKNDLDSGLRWRRVYEFCGGDWVVRSNGTFTQDIFAYYISMGCNHCQDPVCVNVCPSCAMHKDASGIVLIDSKKCVGCRYCEWVCPYSAPQFDYTNGIMTKCDFCQSQIQEGREPCCVEACPTHALLFGDYDELIALHGKKGIIAPLPSPEITCPNLVIVPPKQDKLPDYNKGLIQNPEEVKDE
jgi:anaerobic dimethyl sulfoxide reductase subunit B